MRVVAWNIRAGGGRRVEGIHAQLRRWRPDVLVLSEFRATAPSRELAARLAADGWRWQRATVSAAAPARNGLLIAARAPLRRAALRGATPPADRWLSVRAHPGPGDGISLGAMHVPNRASGRKAMFHDAVLAVARRWRPGPALLIGDTNSGRIGVDEEAPAFDRREDGWMAALAAAGWRDAYRALHGDRRAYTWYSPNAGNGFRLDQAFCNAALLPRLRAVRHVWGRVERDARRDALSDHAALVVDLR